MATVSLNRCEFTSLTEIMQAVVSFFSLKTKLIEKYLITVKEMYDVPAAVLCVTEHWSQGKYKVIEGFFNIFYTKVGLLAEAIEFLRYGSECDLDYKEIVYQYKNYKSTQSQTINLRSIITLEDFKYTCQTKPLIEGSDLLLKKAKNKAQVNFTCYFMRYLKSVIHALFDLFIIFIIYRKKLQT